jgi:hypothetical protein
VPRYEGRLELTWTNKHERLLAHDDGSYEWLPPSDYRVAEVRLLDDVGVVGEVSKRSVLSCSPLASVRPSNFLARSAQPGHSITATPAASSSPVTRASAAVARSLRATDRAHPEGGELGEHGTLALPASAPSPWGDDRSPAPSHTVSNVQSSPESTAPGGNQEVGVPVIRGQNLVGSGVDVTESVA